MKDNSTKRSTPIGSYPWDVVDVVRAVGVDIEARMRLKMWIVQTHPILSCRAAASAAVHSVVICTTPFAVRAAIAAPIL